MIDINELRQSLGAVQPEEVAVLLNRLEAAEKEAAHIKEVEFPRKMLAVAVGWETKCVRLEQERDALRAEIEAMEKQEPVAWCATDETGTVIEALGMNQSRRFDTALYLAPGAQPAPTALAGARKVTRDFRWDGATQCHVPMIIVEFEPVPAGSPNDAKGWQDRDRIAAMLAAAPEAKP